MALVQYSPLQVNLQGAGFMSRIRWKSDEIFHFGAPIFAILVAYKWGGFLDSRSEVQWRIK